MARDTLGIFTTEGQLLFPFAIFGYTKGLNFLNDCFMYNNPTTEYRTIGPKVLVEWCGVNDCSED